MNKTCSISRVRASAAAVVFLVVATVGPVSAQDTAENTAETLWKEAGIDFGFIKERVKTRSCQRSEIAFLSCVGSLQAILDHQGRDLQLVHASWRRDGRGALLKAFGAVAVERRIGYQGSELAELLKESRERRRRILAWQRLYREGITEPLDFTGIREWMLANIVKPGSLASFAAAATNGYLTGEDAHARIFPAASGGPGVAEDGRDYTGVGVMLRQLGNVAIAAQVRRDGPAFEAGLRNRDALLSVNGERLDKLEFREIVALLRGPRNTGVIVGVKRGKREFSALVIRDDIRIQNVSHRLISASGLKWGYLRIETFADGRTCREVSRTLSELTEAGAQGLILDLRDNLGGLVGQAACVADLFLPPNQIILTTQSTRVARRGMVFRSQRSAVTGLPVITLVNAGTGSASEVLAGTLQDHRRSLLVGARTFGKGSIQTMKPWDSQGKIMQLATAARYFLPSGRTIQMVGIQPDFEVYRDGSSMDGNALALREEDLFPNALPALDGQPAGPRLAAVELPNACQDMHSPPRYRESNDDESGTDDDPQLGFSQRLLGCLNGFPPYTAGL